MIASHLGDRVGETEVKTVLYEWVIFLRQTPIYIGKDIRELYISIWKK